MGQVFEYMQTDLEVVIKDRSLTFSEGDVKAYMQMVLQGINFCHKRWVLHRDIKPNNFLISQQGMHSWSLTRGSAQLAIFLSYLVFSVCILKLIYQLPKASAHPFTHLVKQSQHEVHAGDVKLGDFGLARIFGSPDRKWTNQVGLLASFYLCTMIRYLASVAFS